jgi:hypothetical protein
MIPRQRAVCLLLLVSQSIWAAPVAKAGQFEFHSNFWLNLHHFLYEQATRPHESLVGEDKAVWDNALAFYRHSMVNHDLLTDLRMRAIDTELAEDETLPRLAGNSEETELWDNLNSVAAIYRAHWWGDHDHRNREFIAAVAPLVQRYGPLIGKQLTTIYETPWPRDPIRVDVAEYANWAGAYTYTYSWSRVHEIVSSANPADQGNTALEILFHEATHGFVADRSGRLADRIALAAQRNHVRVPEDLVHIFIFYTAGEVTRRALADGYIPYADKKHLYQDKWTLWHSRLGVYWKQHVDGSLSLNDAVDKVVKEGGKSGK